MIKISRKKRKKRLSLSGKAVVGIDECNNGFQKQGLPLIIVAHLVPDYIRSNNGAAQFGKKQGAFARKKKQQQQFIRKAKIFLERNPYFIYTTLTKTDVDAYGFYGRAEAIASIIVKAADQYNIDQNNLVALIHRIDQRVHTETVGAYLEDFLVKASFKGRFQFKSQNMAIKKADRVAYFLAGLRRLNSHKKWPFRRLKIDPRYIGQHITQLDRGKYDHFE